MGFTDFEQERKRNAARMRRRGAIIRAEQALEQALQDAGLRHDQNTIDAIVASLLSNGHDIKAVRR